MLCALDVALLTICAQSCSLAQMAADDVSRNGLTGARGDKNPSLAVLRGANDMILKCLDRMGLAPAERDRLNVPTAPKPSKFGDLLHGGRG